MERDNTWGVEGAARPVTAEAAPALPPLCRKCRRVIDSTYAYCPHCGQRQNLGSAWYYHHVWILLLAFVALGPLALPLVWRSQQMGRIAKIITTVAILLYTVYGVYVFWKILTMELKFSSELGDIMREIHPR